MAKEDFQRLLAEFRSAWCKHSRDSFHLEVFAPSFISMGVPPKDHPPYDYDKYELVAQVALPLDATREITPDQQNSTLCGYGVIAKNDKTTEARAMFTRLCGEAGAALPPEFRDRLAGLCHWDMPESASWWLALLVYLSGADAYFPDGRYEGHALIPRPFLNSVDAIERCKLDSDYPELPAVTYGDIQPPGSAGKPYRQFEGDIDTSGIPIPQHIWDIAMEVQRLLSDYDAIDHWRERVGAWYSEVENQKKKGDYDDLRVTPLPFSPSNAKIYAILAAIYDNVAIHEADAEVIDPWFCDLLLEEGNDTDTRQSTSNETYNVLIVKVLEIPPDEHDRLHKLFETVENDLKALIDIADLSSRISMVDESQVVSNSDKAMAHPSAAGTPPAANIFKLDNDTWTIRFNGGEIQRGFRDVKPARDICYLLRNRGQEFSILDLPDNRRLNPQMSSTAVATKEDCHHLVSQIQTLKGELENEDDFLVRQETEAEIAALENQFNQNFNKNGQPRKLSGDLTKIIEKTQSRIFREFIPKKLTPRLSLLAAHLDKTLKISATCLYAPESEIDWDCGPDD